MVKIRYSLKIEVAVMISLSHYCVVTLKYDVFVSIHDFELYKQIYPLYFN